MRKKPLKLKDLFWKSHTATMKALVSSMESWGILRRNHMVFLGVIETHHNCASILCKVLLCIVFTTVGSIRFILGDVLLTIFPKGENPLYIENSDCPTNSVLSSKSNVNMRCTFHYVERQRSFFKYSSCFARRSNFEWCHRDENISTIRTVTLNKVGMRYTNSF